MNLHDFMRESNAIEGIHGEDRIAQELPAMESFISSPLSTKSVINLVMILQPKAHGRANGLRTQPGMDVRVGNHLPPRGGPDIEPAFEGIIKRAAENAADAYQVHVDYETLHPFMDGNGRTGRAVWLWQMLTFYGYRYQLGFLHCWYYRSLDYGRPTSSTGHVAEPK